MGAALIGEELGHYTVVELLGKGGMGAVYRAHDTRLNREVALKILPTEVAEDEERLQRFQREARILASLNHPHIATIHGFDNAGTHRFLVMELVEGENLAERMRRGRIDTKQALEIGRQIADGLAYAHENGVVHRDLKPANVQLTAEGTVKILDFGLAFATHDTEESDENSPTVSDALTMAGTLLGTAAYMSPEVLKGHRADARSDIWALGCILYEMLSHTRAHSGKTTTEIIAAILERTPEWDQLPESVPGSVVRLLHRCLAKDPRSRMHAAADVRLELQEAEEEAKAPVLSPPRSSGRLVAGAATGAFLVGAALVLGWMSLRGGSREPGSTARLLVPTPDRAPIIPLPETSSVAMAPDGEYLVYLAPSTSGRVRAGGAAANSTQLYLRELNSFEIHPLEGTTGATSPFISPDSEWIGFLSADLALAKLSRNGGAPQEICGDLPTGFRQATWADNDSIYFSGTYSGIHVVSATGSGHREVAIPDRSKQEKTYRFPDALPGCRALLFTRADSQIQSYDEAEVALLNLQTGDIDVLVRGGTNPRYVASGHVVYGRGGKLFAIPFDLDALQVTGPPVTVIDGVVTSEGYGSVDFGVSRTGTLTYVAGGPEQYTFELLLLDGDGRLETIPQLPRRYGSVNVSPDGKQLVVSDLGANASVWVYEMDRGTMTRLVSGWDNHSPVWHPEQELLAFASNRSGEDQIWMTAADGSGEDALLRGSAGVRYPSSWSPDGKWISSTFDSPLGGSDIRFLDATGEAETTPSIAGPAGEYYARFSPDGRWVAYLSDESGQIEVYVQEFPITGRKWKISEDGGSVPAWSADGHELYYVSQDRLMHVALQLEPEFRPAKASQLLDVPASDIVSLDVFPDGERFVLIARRDAMRKRRIPVVRSEGGQIRMFPARSPDLRVVVNWFDELRRSNSP
jgi:serine/threonine-protein kinase